MKLILLYKHLIFSIGVDEHEVCFYFVYSLAGKGKGVQC